MFELPKLPYGLDALAPVISATTLSVHHGKHHAKYVETLNQLLGKSGTREESLEAVIAGARARPDAAKLFNNAAQAWNHSFFWAAMSPRRQQPSGALAAAIDRTFGGVEALKTAFVEEGVGHFASGWVWLAAEGEALKILSTHDAATLAGRDGVVPVLVCDLWEHAYYLDHKQDRKGFLEAWFDALPNWELAGAQYAAARGQGPVWRHPTPVKVEGNVA